MKLTLHNYVPKLLVNRIFWGTGFATPFGIVVASNASSKTPKHEFRHFIQQWVLTLLGIIIFGGIWSIPGVLWLAIYAINFLINIIVNMAFPSVDYTGLTLKQVFSDIVYEAYKNIIFERDARHYAGQ